MKTFTLETYEAALAFATEAHMGQYRKPIVIPFRDANKLVDTSDLLPTSEDGYITLPDGSLLGATEDCRFVYTQTYISHPIAVAAMMDTEYRKVLALLHDVVEDTEYTLIRSVDSDHYLSYYIAHIDHPIQHEISYNLYIDLGLVTKDPNLDYAGNIKRITDSNRKDPLAVKLGDNSHNLSTGSEKQQEKYLGISIPALIAAIK